MSSTHSRSNIAMFLIWMLAGLVGCVSAVDNPAATTVNDVRDAIIAQTAVAGVLAIIVGLFLLFFGHRLFYPTLFFAGFYLFASIGFVILTNVEPSGGFKNRETVLLVGSLAVGLVGGLMAVCLVKFGLACIGAIGGFALSMFILSFKSNGSIESGVGRTIFIILMTLIGSILIFWLVKPVLIVSTSIAGAYAVVAGIDIFAKTGFIASFKAFLTSSNRFNWAVFESNGKVIALLATMVVLAIIGILVQFKSNRGRTFIGGK